MPIVAELAFSGILAAEPPPPATLGGWLAGGPVPAPSFGGALGRGLIAALDAPAVLYGVRVVLAGEDVSADLVGEVSVERSIDQPFARASFQLLGRRYQPTLTERTFTRVPVEIYFAQGPPGAVQERLELAGVVETCQVQDGDRVEVSAGDFGLRFAKTDVCHEVPPLAGLTRGEIVRQLAAGAGVAAIDVPDGAVYAKPYHTGSGKLLELLRAFGEPEGWSWRWRADGTLEAFTTELRRAPEPPDHVWHVDALDAHPALVPPSEVPSRWLVRGTSAVFVDELGLTTERTETRIEAPYAPREAVARQQLDGSLTPLATTFQEAVIPVSLVRDELTKRGDLPVQQVTTEFGWVAPAAGKHRTPEPSEGPGPIGDGYRYTTAFIDAEGRFLAWRAERWVEVGRRVQRWSYDAEGNPTELVVSTHRWHRRAAGVRRASATLLAAGAAVADDDRSYLRIGHVGLAQVERYGLAEEQRIGYAYDPETGALASEEQTAWSYYAPKASLLPALDFWVLADGSAQIEQTASWRLSSRQSRRHAVDASGRLRGQTDRVYGYTALRAANGRYDWGEFRSYAKEETFLLLRREQREIRVESEDSYLEIRYAEGERQETRHLGAPPLPRYLASPWTRLVQQPLEVVLDDPVLARWFGFERRVIQHEHVQSTAEARALLERRLARELSHELHVERAETLAEPGETVLIVDPQMGLCHRALVVSVVKLRELARGRATSRATLEVPLL